MSRIASPSQFIKPAQAALIRQRAFEAEKSGQLHPDQLSLIYAERWFKLFVPASSHGLELSLPEGLRIQEALAWADGPTGWTVTLCSGANWFIGFFQAGIAEALFRNEKVCLAGSGMATGVASLSGNGYEVTGSWRYATGAPHASAFTANCIIEKDGIVQRNPDGSPEVRPFLFLRDDVEIQDDWKAFGMIATASWRFEVRNLKVRRDRCFVIDGLMALLPQPIYQFPFDPFAVATLAVNCSGMAFRFLELCREGIGQDATSRLDAAREMFYDCIESAWEALMRHKQIPEETLSNITRLSRSLAAKALQVTDELFPYCGMLAADSGSEINRVWRNLHTASLHNLLFNRVAG